MTRPYRYGYRVLDDGDFVVGDWDSPDLRVATGSSSGAVTARNGLTVTAGGLTVTAGGITLNGDNLTVADDILLGIGTGNTARISYDTTDANANALLIQLPAGGSTDVPVIAIGQSIESVDLGLYNGVVDPRIALFGVGAVTTGPVIEFRKARGTITAPTVVTSGDDVGTLDFYGAVAAGEYVRAASIRADMAGTIATTRGPGTLTFLTATDAAPSVLTEALAISAAQLVTCASLTSTGAFTASSTAALNGNVTVADDILLGVGTGNTARFSYDTTDANANALLLQMPAGGGTDVPVLAIGQSIESVDLGLYNGVVDPRIALFGVGAVTTGPVIEFRKARGTIASPTVVTTGDDVGTIRGYAAVAAGEYVQTAEIRMDCAGTIATTRGPGTITFLTATDAAPSVLTQAMIISADQKVTIASGESTGDFKLNLTLTAGGDGVGGDGEQLTSGGAAAECDWSAAGSLRQFKNILGLRTDAEAALRTIIETPVYDFRYKQKSESAERITSTGDVETVYTGIMAEDAPWAMHHKGRIVNPINALGYTVLAIQAMVARLSALEAKLAG